METPRSDNTHTNATSRTASFGSGHEPLDYLNLPVREVSDGADLREYTTETREGEIIKPVKSNVTGKLEDWKLVTFTIDDPENPKNWSKLYKWYCTMVVAFTCFVVAFASSVITAHIEGPMEDFGVSREASLVVVTVFVVGFGVGKSARRFPLLIIVVLTLSRPHVLCSYVRNARTSANICCHPLDCRCLHHSMCRRQEYWNPNRVPFDRRYRFQCTYDFGRWYSRRFVEE
jgi:hypothetical protein